MNLSINTINRSKRAYSNSRYIDNHFDSKLHSTPFLPIGLTDIGYSETRTQSSKLKNFKDLEQKNISVSKLMKSQGNWRQFVEFAQEQQPIITIEYCTNCKQHQQSTRHNEEQYLQNALFIKQLILHQYPEMKVYLKPLVYENDKSIKSLFLQRRIGAFEIQLQMNGQQVMLFSKLHNKIWPDGTQIMKAIHHALKKTNLLVQLKFDDGDESLKNITVTLERPNQQLRTISQLSETRTKSLSLHRQRAISQSNQIQLYSEKSDNQGRVLFLNIPIDKYELIIPETINSLPVNQIVHLQELVREDGSYYGITLQKPKISTLIVEILGPQEGTGNIIPFSDTQVFVSHNQERLLLKEVSGNSGIYEGCMEPGLYGIVAHKYGYENIQQQFQVHGGQNKIKLEFSKRTELADFSRMTDFSCWTEQSIKKRPVSVKLKTNPTKTSLVVGQIYIHDIFTGQPISNAKVKITDSELKRVVTTTSSLIGSAKIIFNGLNKGLIQIEHQDYYFFEQQYEVNVLKNNFYYLTKISQLNILAEQAIIIYCEGVQLKGVNNRQNMTLLEIQLTNDSRNSLLYSILYEQYTSKLFILQQQGMQTIVCQQQDFTKFPKYWLIGTYNNEGFSEINQIVDYEEFCNYQNEKIDNIKPLNKVFWQGCYLSGDNFIYNDHLFQMQSTIINVIINYEEIPVVFFQNQTYWIDQQIQTLTIPTEQIQIQQQISSFNQQQQTTNAINLSSNENVNQVYRIHKLIFIIYHHVIAIYNENLKAKWLAKFSCYYIKELQQQQAITVGIEFVTLLEINSFQIKQIKQIQVHGKINVIQEMENEKLIFGREDGAISIYTNQLVEIHHIRISSNPIKQITQTKLIIDDYNIFTYQYDEELQFTKYLKQKSKILFVNQINNNLIVYNKQSQLIYYMDNLKRTNNEPNSTQLIISGCPNYSPIILYQNKQESIMKLENDKWIVNLLNENVKIGLSLKGAVQEINIKMISNKEGINLGNFKMKRTKGIWIFGIILYVDETHKLQQLIDQYDDTMQFDLSIPMKILITQCIDKGIFIQDEDKYLKYLSIKNFKQYFQLPFNEKISTIKKCNNALLIGDAIGKVYLYQTEAQTVYFKQLEIQLNDKNISDLLLMDHSLFISSEDRKFQMININNDLKVEFVELVDKSYINQIVEYLKNYIITSYVDGRIRLWKREKSGQQFQLTQVKTTQVMKQISKIQQIPWQQDYILICGEQLLLFNPDTQKINRVYKNGHKNKITSIACIWNTIIISGCVDGLFIQWNYSTTEILNVVNMNSKIYQIICSEENIVTQTEQGLHIQ